MWSALAACLLTMADPIPPELDAYLVRPDPSFAWSRKAQGLGSLHIRMTSQTWRKVRWTHDIVLVEEESQDAAAVLRDAAILYITGGEPNPADLDEAKRLSRLAKMPVALLFQIPNQPLFGKTEDDLIAHTFEQYLRDSAEGGDAAEWPLLFPMTKSALRAMDALEEATEETSRPLKRFVVTGASKRGWTAWLVGAARDGRVLGIAPMVFDNLRFKEQLQHQLASWGKYSEMLGDYTEKGLDQIVDTPTGRRLVAMTDPWTYRERLTLPKLIVIGSNDRYWATDALSLYWDALRGPKYVSVVPNAGHLLGDMKQALAAIAAFARSCAGEFAIAPHGGGLSEERGKKTYRVWVEATASKSAGPCTVAEPVGVWSATADNGDLRGARWERGAPTQSAEPKKGIARAFFGEVRHRFGDLAFTLSTPPAVVR